MAQEDIRQGVSQILEMLSNMSDNPHSARNVAAAAGGRYVGSALNTPSMGFMTFGGNMGHSPMQVGPQDFANQLLGMAVAPSLNRIFSPYSNLNSDVMYAQNHAQVQQAGMMNSLAKVMAERIESSNLGIKDGTPLARVMTSQFFSGPLTDEKLQMMSRFGMDRNEELRKGMMDSGISSIGLQQFGLVGSLMRQDQLRDLRETIETAAEDTVGIGEADTLGTAMILGDPRMNLALSLESKGFGGPEKLAKTTESLKRAKELTGMGGRQTLGLLAEVYDNVIEGVLPDIDKFVDRMMRLERQGVSVTEFSSTVQNMRGRLGRAGVRDGEVAISVVENALGGRESTREMQWNAGNSRFNQRVYEGNQLAREQKVATSSEANALAVFADLAGVDLDDPNLDLNAAMRAGLSGLPKKLQDDLKLYASGELSSTTLSRRAKDGDYGQEVVHALQTGAAQGYGSLIQNDSTFRAETRLKNITHGARTSLLPQELKKLLSEGDDLQLNKNYAAALEITELANGKYTTPDARAKYLSDHNLTENEDGSITHENGVTLSAEMINSVNLSSVRWASMNLETGKSQYDYDKDQAFGMYGLGKTKESAGSRDITEDDKDGTGDFKKAREHIRKLITGNAETAKTSADTLLGVALEAATSVHGGSDFTSVFELMTKDHSDKDWAETNEKFKKRVMDNEVLRDAIGIDKNDTLEEVGAKWEAAWNNNERELAKTGDSRITGESRDKLIGLRDTMRGTQSGTKFGGGAVESLDATVSKALPEMAENIDRIAKVVTLGGLQEDGLKAAAAVVDFTKAFFGGDGEVAG